jgi:hypothetical protein
MRKGRYIIMTLFFSGVMATIGLVGLFCAGYLLGNKKTPKSIARPPSNRIEGEEREYMKKQLQIQKDFNEVMSYDEHKAYSKKVN